MLLSHKYHVHPESGTEKRYGQAVCGGQQGVRRAGGEEWQEVSRAGACSPRVKEASVQGPDQVQELYQRLMSRA